MQNIKLPASDLRALDGIAELLLWFGRDRAADVIYAAIEIERATECGCTAGEWKVFAG